MMSGAVAFDTLEFVETLKAGGVSEGQAKVFAIAVRKSHESSDVATRQDIKDLHSEIASMKKDLYGEIAAVKSDLRREITEIKYDLLKWFVGFSLTNIALLIGILFRVLSELSHSLHAQVSAPDVVFFAMSTDTRSL